MLRRTLLAILLGVSFLTASAADQPKPELVQTEDGRSFLGLVTIKDDYTISIATDSGFANIPIAALKGDSWKKYSSDKDRQKDGRFWAERQDALTNKWNNEGKPGPLDSFLSEVLPHQSSIITYREAREKEASKNLSSSPAASGAVEIKLFSGPGALGQPASLPQIPGSLPSVPSSPSVPSFP